MTAQFEERPGDRNRPAPARTADELTVQECLDLAWEKASVPDDGMIREGEDHLTLFPGGEIVLSRAIVSFPSKLNAYVSRLLSPRPASEWVTAEYVWADKDEGRIERTVYQQLPGGWYAAGAIRGKTHSEMAALNPVPVKPEEDDE